MKTVRFQYIQRQADFNRIKGSEIDARHKVINSASTTGKTFGKDKIRSISYTRINSKWEEGTGKKYK